jgi:IPT/TIG domain
MRRSRTARLFAGGLLLGVLSLCAPGTPAGGLAAAASPAPTLERLEPPSGPEAGGTPVTITGTGLTAETAVRFGAAAATSVEFKSETEVVAISPAGSGAVEVAVTTAGGTSATSAGDTFTYTAPPAPAPALERLEPSSGGEEGGTVVMITGSNLAGATAVDFGSAAALGFEVRSATEIVADSPAGSGAVEVTVTTPAGTSAASAGDTFTYTSLSAGSGGEPEAPEEPFNLEAFLAQLAAEGFSFPSTGGSSPAGGGSGPSAASGRALATATRRQRGVRVNGTVDVPSEDAGARLEVELLAAGGSPARARPVDRALLGQLTIGSVRSGRVSFSVPLNARGRRALGRHRKLGLTVRITLAPEHGAASVLTHDVLLSAPAHAMGAAPA